MLEVVGQLQSTLAARVADVADLGRLVLLPDLLVELGVEVLEGAGADEVDEGVAHVAVVLSNRPGTSLSMGR